MQASYIHGRKWKNSCACFLALSLLMGCRFAQESLVPIPPAPVATRAKNIILLIGDGLGLAQVSASHYWKGTHRSVYTRFPVVGFHQSHASNAKVTDSAAGATAFACGQKTYNGAIGVVPPNREPCHTILEDMDEQGYATGMVVTCSATHATPAAFIAHQEARSFNEFLAEDYLKTAIDCFIGGGEFYFTKRPDKRNLEDSLRTRGYVVRSGSIFQKLPLDGSAPFMLFTAEHEPPTASAGRIYLPEATKMVCRYLQKRSQKGFFLMVEGSQIDWALHGNDRNWLKAELLDFDAAVAAALDFATANGETLVIVTGDHECGGLALTESTTERFSPKFAARVHTAALVPVFAYGPQAHTFSGIFDNTRLYYKMWDALKK